MKPRHIRSIIIFLFFVMMVVFGCGDSGPAGTGKTKEHEKGSPLIGAWRKIAEGQKAVSDVEVNMIISAQSLTMDAPGCLITGNYTAADGILTFTITAMEGPQCASGQNIGKSDSVYYTVTDSKLTLIPLLAGEENKLVYQRVD